MGLILIAASIATCILFFTIYEYLESSEVDGAANNKSVYRARFVMVAIIAALAAASLLFRGLVSHGLNQSAGLFIGIPTVIALAAIFAPAGTATAVAVKAVTLGLMMALMFLGEGILCVLMSAPLFYLVAVVIGALADHNNGPSHRSRIFSLMGFLAMVPMSLEGVTPLTTIERTVTVSETRLVDASAAEVAAAIETAPRFERTLPRYLRMGFPRPTSTRIAAGTWRITMRGGEMRLNGMEPRAGDLVLERDAPGANFVSWRAVSDDSHMTHFLNWERSRVDWQAVDRDTTRVTWTLSYRRGLDPAWYFGPMERYAVGLAAGYLIDSVARP
jgi:hypothetical protein